MMKKRLVWISLLIGLLSAPLVLAQDTAIRNIFARALSYIFFTPASVGGDYIYSLYIRFIVFVVTFAIFYTGVSKVLGTKTETAGHGSRNSLAAVVAFALALLAVIGIPDRIILAIAATLSTAIAIAWALMLPIILFYFCRTHFKEDTTFNHGMRAVLYGVATIVTLWFTSEFFNSTDLKYTAAAEWGAMSAVLTFFAAVGNLFAMVQVRREMSGDIERGDSGGIISNLFRGRERAPERGPYHPPAQGGTITLTPETESLLKSSAEAVQQQAKQLQTDSQELKKLIAESQEKLAEALAKLTAQNAPPQEKKPIEDALKKTEGEQQAAEQAAADAAQAGENAKEAAEQEDPVGVQQAAERVKELRQDQKEAGEQHQKTMVTVINNVPDIPAPDKDKLRADASEAAAIAAKAEGTIKDSEAAAKAAKDAEDKMRKDTEAARKQQQAAEQSVQQEMDRIIAETAQLETSLQQIKGTETKEVMARLQSMKQLLVQVTTIEASIQALEKNTTESGKQQLATQRKKLQELVRELADIARATSSNLNTQARSLIKTSADIAIEVERIKKIGTLPPDPRVADIDKQIHAAIMSIDTTYAKQLQKFNEVMKDIQEEAKEFEGLAAAFQAIAGKSAIEAYSFVSQLQKSVDRLIIEAGQATTVQEAEKQFTAAVRAIATQIQKLITERKKILGGPQRVVVEGQNIKVTRK